MPWIILIFCVIIECSRDQMITGRFWQRSRASRLSAGCFVSSFLFPNHYSLGHMSQLISGSKLNGSRVAYIWRVFHPSRVLVALWHTICKTSLRNKKDYSHSLILNQWDDRLIRGDQREFDILMCNHNLTSWFEAVQDCHPTAALIHPASGSLLTLKSGLACICRCGYS